MGEAAQERVAWNSQEAPKRLGRGRRALDSGVWPRGFTEPSRARRTPRIDDLIAAVARAEGPERVESAVRTLVAAVHERLAAERPDLHDTLPPLARRVTAVMAHKRQVWSAVRALRRYARVHAPPPLIGFHLSAFEDAWRAHLNLEIALLQDELLTDLGTGG